MQEVTYWSSAMSSRVRVSKRWWMSGLERTVSGILTTGTEQVQRQMLWDEHPVLFNRINV